MRFSGNGGGFNEKLEKKGIPMPYCRNASLLLYLQKKIKDNGNKYDTAFFNCYSE